MCAEKPNQRSDVPRAGNISPPDQTRSLEAGRRIDAICRAFQDACRPGVMPQLEDFVEAASASERNGILRNLLRLELNYRRRLDEQPSAEKYLSRFPTDGPIIAEVFAETSNESPEVLRVEIREGARLGRYVIGQILGQGSFGTVYLARDDQLQRPVAIKVPRWMPSTACEGLHDYLEEARTVAQLQHPGIASVFDAGCTEDGIPYIVSQYIDGGSLKERLANDPLEMSYAVGLMTQVAEAVQCAHRQGFVHRDLKPGNILIDSQEKPFIVDFGVALHESVQREKAWDVSGTLAYMSPEQLRGESHRLDGRADIWSLGVILYELLTSRRPFEADNAAHLEEEILTRDPKPPRQINDDIPAELERICLRCLAKDVTQRYSSAADLARDLRGWLQPRRKISRNVFAAVFLLFVGGLGAWLFWPTTQLTLPSPPNLSGMLDLFIWNPDDPTRLGLSLLDQEALPLRANDRIRIQVTLNRPAYLYVVWIDSRGKAMPVYPWKPGHWEQRPEDEIPIERIDLPSVEDRGWKMEGPSGMETVMLLARDTPLPREVDLEKRFAQLPATNLPNPRALVCFSQGRPITAAMDVQRGPNFFNTEQIDDPVLTTQQLIHERLGKYFPLMRAMSVASVCQETKP